MPHCIIVMRDAKYCILGPFASRDALYEWTEKHWREPDRKPGSSMDPRWQVLELADPHAAPVVLAPSDPAAVAAIQE